MSLRQAMQDAQERARARREAAAAAVREGSISLARRLDFDNLSDEEPELDEQQQRYDALAREEQRRIQRGDAFGIRSQQDRELEENQRLQRSQPRSGGKRRKSRKFRKSRKVGGRKSHKSRKVGGGRKSRKVGGGRKSSKSRKVRKSRR